jgi:hypothetical protein
VVFPSTWERHLSSSGVPEHMRASLV